MQTWRRSDLNGYAHGRREIAGIVKGEAGRAWIFFDGVATHRVPMQFAEWNPHTGIMTMPNWLVIRLLARARQATRERFRKRPRA